MTGSGEDACHAAAGGWTPRTNDVFRAARVERTVAVTENGPGS
ncbi:Methionine aminopeptidase [Streptomyces hygroscopicus subsp. limoneus]|nr:Methionine aminopeptidase [Streptomyces hygroscopicus subsp. limoneus]